MRRYGVKKFDLDGMWYVYDKEAYLQVALSWHFSWSQAYDAAERLNRRA